MACHQTMQYKKDEALKKTRVTLKSGEKGEHEGQNQRLFLDQGSRCTQLYYVHDEYRKSV